MANYMGEMSIELEITSKLPTEAPLKQTEILQDIIKITGYSLLKLAQPISTNITMQTNDRQKCRKTRKSKGKPTGQNKEKTEANKRRN